MRLFNPQPEADDHRDCPLPVTARELELLAVLRTVWDLSSKAREADSLEGAAHALERIFEEVAEILADVQVALSEDI